MRGQGTHLALPFKQIGFRHALQGLADIDQINLPGTRPKRTNGDPLRAAVATEHSKGIGVASFPQQNGVSDDLFAGCSRWRRASAAEFGVRHQKNRSSRMPGHSGPVRAL